MWYKFSSFIFYRNISSQLVPCYTNKFQMGINSLMNDVTRVERRSRFRYMLDVGRVNLRDVIHEKRRQTDDVVVFVIRQIRIVDFVDQKVGPDCFDRHETRSVAHSEVGRNCKS